jgi:hypothetical protein
MICKPCREGGECNSGGYYLLALELHGKCKGETWCDCQHDVGRTARAGKEPK